MTPPAARASNKPALVIPQRGIDATPTPPPDGYVAPTGTATAGDTAAPAGGTPDPADTTPAGPPAGTAVVEASNGHRRENDDTGAGDTDADDAVLTYASEHQVQAARLAVRAFARHRDALAVKAAAALEALDGLRANGGNDAQVRMVLADGRTRLSELQRHGGR